MNCKICNIKIIEQDLEINLKHHKPKYLCHECVIRQDRNRRNIDYNNLENIPAQPFIKWAGGKRNLLDKLQKNIINDYDNYYEPFIGGGALFFKINTENGYISDINTDLITTYNVVKYFPLDLIKALKNHSENHTKEYYYLIRSQHNLTDIVEIAARFIYLNKTCFNGLYRVNKSGKFNVPIGSYKNPNIVQEQNILACSKALQKTDIKNINFYDINPKSGDLVYFDPPYDPINDTSFTTYTKDDFKRNEQIKLRDFALKLYENGVYVIISNSNTEFIRDIYSSYIFNINIINAPRNISCKSRKSVEEVIITMRLKE